MFVLFHMFVLIYIAHFDCVCLLVCRSLEISRVITTCLTTAINGHDDKLDDIVELIPYTEEFVSTVATITPVCLCMFVFSFSTAVFVCSLVGQPRS